MRCAVCCPRSDPPSTRERLNTATLPQARHRGVLLSLSNSHCTQNTADCKETKFTSAAVSERCIGLISSLTDGKDERKQSRPREKVTALVRAVDNWSDGSGFKVSRFQSFR